MPDFSDSSHSEAARRRAARTPFRKLVLATYAGCGGILVFSALCAFGYMRYQVVCRDAALERLRASGAPVYVADIPVVDGPGPSADEWVRKAAALEELPSFDDAPMSVIELEHGLTPARHSGLVQFDAACAAHCALAEEAHGLDPLRAVGHGVRDSAPRAIGLAIAQRVRLRAIDGDCAAASAAARSLLDVAALWRTPGYVGALEVPVFLLLQYLRACEDVLRLAPASFDTDAELPDVSRQPWVDALRFAFAAERACLNEEYARGAPPATDESQFPWDQWRERACFELFHVPAQRWQLDECARVSTAFELTRDQRWAMEWMAPQPGYLRYGFAHRELGGTGYETSWSLRHMLGLLDHLDTQAALVRLARIARRSGARAAAEAASKTLDPYTECPFVVEHADGRLHIRSRGLVVDDLLAPGCVRGGDNPARPRLSLDWRDE